MCFYLNRVLLTEEYFVSEKVSIIIPVFNGSNFLKKAIDSALAQTYKNIEVIVVNDGSSDKGKTRMIAESYGSKIRYYEKSNGGVASALNFAIERMEGDFFAWLSHDDEYFPTKIEEQMKLIELNGSDAIIICDYNIINARGKVINEIILEDRFLHSEIEKPYFLLFREKINGCTLLFSKKHFDRVGVFNEKLRTTQDYDMWFRMLKDQKIVYSDKVLFSSRAHRKQGSRTIKTMPEEKRELWSRMIKEVDKKNMREIAGTEAAFYLLMSNKVAMDQELSLFCLENYKKLLEEEDCENNGMAIGNIKGEILLEDTRLLLKQVKQRLMLSLKYRLLT